MKQILILFFLFTLAGCGVAPTLVTQGELSVALATEPAPPLAGRDTLVTLTLTEAGAPLSGATVGLRRSMPGMTHDSDQDLVPAAELGDGRYQATTSFTMGGRWDVVVVISAADGAERTIRIPVAVEQP